VDRNRRRRAVQQGGVSALNHRFERVALLQHARSEPPRWGGWENGVELIRKLAASLPKTLRIALGGRSEASDR
jgi:hypothetical protein